MRVAVITESQLGDVVPVAQTCAPYTDVYELRVDQLAECVMAPRELVQVLKPVLAQLPKPMILTLRGNNDQGGFQSAEAVRWQYLEALASLQPAYLDIESHVPVSVLERIHQAYPAIALIRSYHNFQTTPDNLNAILSSLQHPAVSRYKVITTATSSLDMFATLNLVRTHRTEMALVSHCMGELGVPSRILGAVAGNCFHYASARAGNQPAPGCLDIETFEKTYRLSQLNSETSIYALLGDPVAQSHGHLWHNARFAEQARNAVYVKLCVKTHELERFFTKLTEINLQGLSITMPHKTHIVPWVSVVDVQQQPIGAYNTVRIRQGSIEACNTDGTGACDALEAVRPIAGARVLLLGAGGAARAIAFELHRRGAAKIRVVNRSLARAQALAEATEGDAVELNLACKDRAYPVDIILNTLPKAASAQPKVVELIRAYATAQTLFMDINYADPASELVEVIQSLHCQSVDGCKMFVNQANQQQQFWFNLPAGSVAIT